MTKISSIKRARTNSLSFFATTKIRHKVTARVSYGEVRTAVRSLKTSKSPGLDRIFNEHIIYGGESAIHLLCHLNNANNYRPITLIPCICKLFKKVMLNRINKVKT